MLQRISDMPESTRKDGKKHIVSLLLLFLLIMSPGSGGHGGQDDESGGREITGLTEARISDASVPDSAIDDEHDRGHPGIGGEIPYTHDEIPDGGVFRPKNTFSGRIGFDVTDSPVNLTYPNAYDTGWSDYHSMRRHFDPVSGMPVSADEQVPGALAPLPATITFSYLYGEDPTRLCPNPVVETDRDGFFTVTLPPCPDYQLFEMPDIIKARIQLIHRMKGPLYRRGGKEVEFGTVRAVWPRDEIEPLYPVPAGSPVYTQMEKGTLVEYVYLTYYLEYTPKNMQQPKPGYPNFDLGIRDVLEGVPPVAEGTLSLNLVRWQTIVELHYRLYTKLFAEFAAPRYQDMFIDNPDTNCVDCYSMVIGGDQSTGGGIGGSVFWGGPKPNTIWHDSLRPTAHEFGHSIHYALAPKSAGGWDYIFASAYIDGDGETGYRTHWHDQHQDMGTAYVEGVAAALGSYLVEGCNSPWNEYYIYKGPEPWVAYNLEVDQSCDQDKGKCGYHNFRWHMSERGIEEGSSSWDHREGLVSSLNSVYGKSYGKPPYVTSNNEVRYQLFLCDLLTENTDIGHRDGGQRAGIEYIQNGYTFLVGKAYDGVNVEPVMTNYEDDVGPKTVQLSIVEFLDTMDGFFDMQTTQLPKIGEYLYAESRLSLIAYQSPHTLGQYLMVQGLIDIFQLNNIFRANYMEEIVLKHWPTQTPLDSEIPLLPNEPYLPTPQN